MEETSLDDTVVKKITFSRDLRDSDFRDLRKMLGHKVVQEGTRHVVVAFDSNMDYLAFLVATGQATVEPMT